MRFDYLPLAVLASMLSEVSIAQVPNDLYITCDLVDTYEGSGKKEFSKVHYKIDTVSGLISKFYEADGLYYNICGDNVDGHYNLGDTKGDCRVMDDRFYVKRRTYFNGRTVFEANTFYRFSGKYIGYSVMYKGNIPDVSGAINYYPVSQSSTDGMCRKGTDMSSSEKAF